MSKQLLEMAEIEVGDDVEIVVDENQIVVRKARRPRFDLAELVKRIPEGYAAGEEDLGGPVGREEW